MIKNVKIFEIPIFHDIRGHFIQLKLKEIRDIFGNNGDIILFNQSNSKKGVLRGLHQQINGKEQAKLINCPTGVVLDLIVDYRRDSETHMEKMMVLLDKPNKYIFIPRGCLHGFISLKEDTILNYYTDNEYSPQNERTIPWTLIKDALDWKLLKKYGIESEKDFILIGRDNKIQK